AMSSAAKFRKLCLAWVFTIVFGSGGGLAEPAQDTEALKTFALAYGAFKDGLDQLAETQLRGFLEHYPQHERVCEAHFLLGELLCRNGRRADGLVEYEKVYGGPKRCSMAVDARMHAAAELRQSGEPKQALVLLQAVLHAAGREAAC